MHGFGKKMDSVWYIYFVLLSYHALLRHLTSPHLSSQLNSYHLAFALAFFFFSFSLTPFLPLSTARCCTQYNIKTKRNETKLRNEKDFYSSSSSTSVVADKAKERSVVSLGKRNLKWEKNPLALISSLNTETKVDVVVVIFPLTSSHLINNIQHTHPWCMGLKRFLDQYLFTFYIFWH